MYIKKKPNYLKSRFRLINPFRKFSKGGFRNTYLQIKTLFILCNPYLIIQPLNTMFFFPPDIRKYYYAWYSPQNVWIIHIKTLLFTLHPPAGIWYIIWYGAYKPNAKESRHNHFYHSTSHKTPPIHPSVTTNYNTFTHVKIKYEKRSLEWKNVQHRDIFRANNLE